MASVDELILEEVHGGLNYSEPLLNEVTPVVTDQVLTEITSDIVCAPVPVVPMTEFPEHQKGQVSGCLRRETGVKVIVENVYISTSLIIQFKVFPLASTNNIYETFNAIVKLEDMQKLSTSDSVLDFAWSQVYKRVDEWISQEVFCWLGPKSDIIKVNNSVKFSKRHRGV